MQKDILLDMVKQNKFTSHFSFDRVAEENASLRLNEHTASIGFIFRHIGVPQNLGMPVTQVFACRDQKATPL